MNRVKQIQGFSLSELLVVIGIVAILSTIVFTAVRPLMQRQQVAEAASQVAQSLQQLRSAAAKTSRNATLTFNTSKPKEYTITYWSSSATASGATVSGAAVTQTVTLPNGASMDIAGASGVTSIDYQAPYGEVAIPNRTITITPNNGRADMAKKIYIVGVTGQVHE